MSKVNFLIQYEIHQDRREEYINLIREIKNLLKVEGLESYQVFEVKGKPNNYQEIYTFNSTEAYENFDDDQNERLNILISKLNNLTVENSTRYTTLLELDSI